MQSNATARCSSAGWSPKASSRLLLLVAVLAAAAAAAGKRYRVGGPDGWVVPPPDDKELYYVRWASSMTFYIGDSIEFEYKNDSVIMVTKAGYYHCNETAGIDAGDVPVPGDGVRVFILYTPGYTYFASADLDHCNKGQRLMINVLTDEPPAPAPSPSFPAPAQSPSSSTPPLSPSPAPAPSFSRSAQASSSSMPPLSLSPTPVPAPSTDYVTGAGSAFAASLASALAAAAMAMAALV
ncbi:hypothetical protein E2562_021064 [Oryza meyeriana var. granulata]|uniref:Phytocyanin domain-containing protein n=1 Tax=Oryza meyeriana var. granulata TaxID=110450 RepID=A0A6G1FAM3_9ORYZ|nr:hypothetical protein E2562_021064 [Oryza meyeriana var. granulata]